MHSITCAKTEASQARDVSGLLLAQRNIRQSTLTAAQKSVYLAILSHWSRKSPTPFPSAELLEIETSMDKRSIRRATTALGKAGYLGVTKAYKAANRYDVSAAFAGRLPKDPRLSPDSVSAQTSLSADKNASLTGQPVQFSPDKKCTLRDQGSRDQKEGIKREPPALSSTAEKGERGATKKPMPAGRWWTDRHKSWAEHWKVDIDTTFAAFVAEHSNARSSMWHGWLMGYIADAGKALAPKIASGAVVYCEASRGYVTPAVRAENRARVARAIAAREAEANAKRGPAATQAERDAIFAEYDLKRAANQ